MPMPARLWSSRESAWMRSLASCTIVGEALLGAVARARPRRPGVSTAIARRDLARLRAAHAVGDGEQRRARVERVLVGPALTPGVRAVELLGDPEHQPWNTKFESPIRIRSPACSGCGPRSSSSLR